jgi:hypothetical protein
MKIEVTGIKKEEWSFRVTVLLELMKTGRR